MASSREKIFYVGDFFLIIVEYWRGCALGGVSAPTLWYEPKIDITERFQYFFIRPLQMLWREKLCWTLLLVFDKQRGKLFSSLLRYVFLQ